MRRFHISCNMRCNAAWRTGPHLGGAAVRGRVHLRRVCFGDAPGDSRRGVGTRARDALHGIRARAKVATDASFGRTAEGIDRFTLWSQTNDAVA